MKLKRVQHPACLHHGCKAPATRAYLYAPGSELFHYRCEAHSPKEGCFEAGFLRLGADPQATKTPKVNGQDQLDLFGTKP